MGTYDRTQLAAMEEKCILVDENDKILGNASKKDCHTVQPNGHIPLHRAFSVFLFNNRGDFLLQKRSSAKITYPDVYSNACCSHPLDEIPGEKEEFNALGVKRAAQRRLNYELGIPVTQLPLDAFRYITRIQYYDAGNGVWGEYEVAYILFLQADVDLTPNSNEVSEISFMPRTHLNTFASELKAPLTPWFDLILKHRLRYWWENLENLDQLVDHKVIHKFT
ncbi:Isopentenyl-diphosphate delta isomerase [Carabus blaptoides fortunei]